MKLPEFGQTEEHRLDIPRQCFGCPRILASKERLKELDEAYAAFMRLSIDLLTDGGKQDLIDMINAVMGEVDDDIFHIEIIEEFVKKILPAEMVDRLDEIDEEIKELIELFKKNTYRCIGSVTLSGDDGIRGAEIEAIICRSDVDDATKGRNPAAHIAPVVINESPDYY